MFALDLHHRAHRPALLQRHRVDLPVKRHLTRRPRHALHAAVLQQAHQFPVPRDLAPAAPQPRHQRPAAFRHPRPDHAGIDLVRLTRLPRRERPRRRRRRALAQLAMALEHRIHRQRVRRPLQRSIRPRRQRPRLHRHRPPLGVKQRQRRIRRATTDRPTHAPGRAGRRCRRLAVQPPHRRRPRRARNRHRRPRRRGRDGPGRRCGGQQRN